MFLWPHVDTRGLVPQGSSLILPLLQPVKHLEYVLIFLITLMAWGLSQEITSYWLMYLIEFVRGGAEVLLGFAYLGVEHFAVGCTFVQFTASFLLNFLPSVLIWFVCQYLPPFFFATSSLLGYLLSCFRCAYRCLASCGFWLVNHNFNCSSQKRLYNQVSYSESSSFQCFHTLLYPVTHRHPLLYLINQYLCSQLVLVAAIRV